MATRITTFANGQTADGGQVESEFNEIYTNITNSNISGSAAISSSKLELGTGSSTDIILNNTKKLIFKNASAASSNYIQEDASNDWIFQISTANKNFYIKGTTTSALFAVTDGSTPIISAQTGGKLRALDSGNTKTFDFYHDGSNALIASSFGNSLFSNNIAGSADNTYSCGISANKWTAVYATNGTIQTSDRRDKKEIKTETLGLEFIQKLKPVTYKWKKGSNGVRHGLIAQQVEKVLAGTPFAGLDLDKDTKRYGLNYGEFISPLILAIQQLSKEVKALQ